MTNELMKAVRLHHFGGPEVLVFEDAPKPAKHPVRNYLRAHLKALVDDLAGFEQTTHAVCGPKSIHDVARELVRCFETPNSCTISTLAQTIDRFEETQE